MFIYQSYDELFHEWAKLDHLRQHVESLRKRHEFEA